MPRGIPKNPKRKLLRRRRTMKMNGLNGHGKKKVYALEGGRMVTYTLKPMLAYIRQK